MTLDHTPLDVHLAELVPYLGQSIESMWYNLAAAQGYQDAMKSRDAMAVLMTPAQIAEAQKLAREWKPKPER